MDRLEHVAFLWDDTGVYGKVFAFEFPQIDLMPPSPNQTVVVMATAPAQTRRTLGTVNAFHLADGKHVPVPPENFRCIDRGWVMKPGQCQTEFWLSWQALGGDALPKKTTIRVGRRLLVIDPPTR